ncbi:MAG: DUF305 domain-containing protein [Gemmatimonadaceae bacterium]|nr:DUF305 domain-containing protein [Gemmatimonadaceae bacterium]
METGVPNITRTKWMAIASLVACAALVGARPYESPLLAECSEAMSTMMSSMRITSHGSADADFAAMMIPHHEGAIAMARSELRHGKNEQLRRLAQEMIITQQQEIVAMRMAAPGESAAGNGEK